MNGTDSRQANGTAGQPQQSVDQSSYELQARSNEMNLSERVRLLDELRRKGVKFTERDVTFITKDRTGQIIWLETGNSHAGLKHIISRHAEDYRQVMGIAQEHIAEALHSTFRDGTVCYSRVKGGTNGGFEKLYLSNGKYYLLSGIGSNGFIVTAYPINARKAQKLIERYGK